MVTAFPIIIPRMVTFSESWGLPCVPSLGMRKFSPETLNRAVLFVWWFVFVFHIIGQVAISKLNPGKRNENTMISSELSFVFQ